MGASRALFALAGRLEKLAESRDTDETLFAALGMSTREYNKVTAIFRELSSAIRQVALEETEEEANED
jgi:hypothetical protein